MSNDPVPTIVQTDEGDLAFQDYFVRRRCEPRVRGFHFEGVDRALPTPGVLDAIEGADLIVICPSNPWVSVDPILAIPGIREALTEKSIVAVSPIIAGQAVKGPAAKMYLELGVEPSALAVAKHFGGLLEGFVLDIKDLEYENAIGALGIRPLVTNTLMKESADRSRLASKVLTFFEKIEKERAK
jgi:LPPG:FO 2-phospho-L-lactate transferase